MRRLPLARCPYELPVTFTTSNSLVLELNTRLPAADSPVHLHVQQTFSNTFRKLHTRQVSASFRREP